MSENVIFTKLPVKAQRRIFDHLTITDREQAKAVCRTWNKFISEDFKLITNENVYKMSREGQRQKDSYLATFPNFIIDFSCPLSFCLTLQKLELSEVIASYNLVKLLQCCLNLENIKFFRFILEKETKFSAEETSLIKLPQVKSFELNVYGLNQDFTNDELILLDLMSQIKFGSLTYISISGHQNIEFHEDKISKRLFQTSPLVNFMVNNHITLTTYNVRNVDFRPLGPRPPAEEWVKLNEKFQKTNLHKISMKFSGSIAKLLLLNQKNLSKLHLEICSNVWEVFMRVLELNSKTLTNIALIYMDAPVSLAILSNCKALRDLCIVSSVGVTDLTLLRAPALKRLGFCITIFPYKHGLLEMVSSLPNLTCLILAILADRYAPEDYVDAELIQKLLQCSNLTTLVFQHTPTKVVEINNFCKRTPGLRFIVRDLAGLEPNEAEDLEFLTIQGGFGANDAHISRFYIFVDPAYERVAGRNENN